MVLSEDIFEISVLTADDDSLVAAAIAAETARQSIRALGSSTNLALVSKVCSRIYRARCGEIQLPPWMLIVRFVSIMQSSAYAGTIYGELNRCRKEPFLGGY